MASASTIARAFDADGFVVLPGFKTPAQIAALRARADQIVEAFDPAITRSVFSTKDETSKDDYFLTSGNTVRCFFEEEALDAEGNLTVPKALAINKIGHAMHDLDPVFEEFSHGTDLAALAATVGLNDPRIYQSMYIFKQPHIGGEVRWHQDATYFVTDPITVTSFWFALEHADRNNGCIWAQRGGHHTPLRERFTVNAGVAAMQTTDAQPWPDNSQAEPLEVEAGTLIVFHGLLPHYSAPNRSASSRHAFILHAVDGSARYSEQNWIVRAPDFPARGFARG
jgi:phytanoyl-CoA hydroxylase